ncbi:hypothetical protein MOSL_0213 [Moraxella osloensis]|nr:hypothetical protein MOSL_0213 [Moraxella osloensis]
MFILLKIHPNTQPIKANTGWIDKIGSRILLDLLYFCKLFPLQPFCEACIFTR